MNQIVFFDGFCNLCNGLVEWLIRKDSSKKIKFASLQGETAKKILPSLMNSKQIDLNTIIYLKNGSELDRSTAILNILFDLGGIWKIVIIFFIIPKFIRDFIYNMIAKNRYLFFGKRNTCRIPSADEQNRILP